MESDAKEDAGKYEINAARFYKDGEHAGLTTPTNVAVTDKNFTVDHFDSYTDGSGTVHAVVLGSDYSSMENVDVYDSIDLSGLPVVTTDGSGSENQDHLNILKQNPVASMRLASGKFKDKAIEAEAETNLFELTPGLNLPVQFAVKNVGADKVDKVVVSGDIDHEFTNLNLLPGETAALVTEYAVPETGVKDLNLRLRPDDGETENIKLVLNCSDVGISEMKVLREENGNRDVQVRLKNGTGIPLSGSGKTVKLGFYKDASLTERIGDEISIPSGSFADIDDGIYTCVKTFDLKDLIGDASEVPEDGVTVYAKTWVEDVDEPYQSNNTANLTLQGLLAKYQEQVTMDVSLSEDDQTYTINGSIRNNSLSARENTYTAVLLDKDGKQIGEKPIEGGSLVTLAGEGKGVPLCDK